MELVVGLVILSQIVLIAWVMLNMPQRDQFVDDESDKPQPRD